MSKGATQFVPPKQAAPDPQVRKVAEAANKKHRPLVPVRKFNPVHKFK